MPDYKGRNKTYIPKRYIVTFLGFIGIFNVFAMRVSVSVSMVAMVKNSEPLFLNTTMLEECPNLLEVQQESGTNEYKGEQYDWDPTTKSSILSAFFYGYMVTQIPGGYFAEAFGAKWLFGLATLATSLFTLCTPLVAGDKTKFIIFRIVQGVCEGVTFPALTCLISKWSPKYERSRLFTVINMGAQTGMVVSMPISGWLSSSDLLGGWPSSFYVFGTAGCLWFFFWAVFVFESPRVHPTISLKELSLLMSEEMPSKKLNTPWKSIFTSVPVWAIVFAHVTHDLGFLVYLTELPSYLNSVLHFNLEVNGALSALPYIFQILTSFLMSAVADRMRKSDILGVTAIRKIFNCIGLLGPAFCLLGITASGCRPELIVALLTLALALNGGVYSGYVTANVDMSPSFAGTIFGLVNTLGNAGGVIAPTIVGYFTSTGETMSNWNKVFYITSGVYISGALVFTVFGSAELQPWNNTEVINHQMDQPIGKASESGKK